MSDSTSDLSKDFQQFGLSDLLLRGIQKQGFDEASPVQQKVIPLAMKGKDLLVGAATGSGKTAAFLLPMMNHFIHNPSHNTGIRGLILTPTRELAKQILDSFMALASFTRLTADVIVGGESFNRQITTLRRNPDILVATPGRLLDQLDANNTDLNDIDFLVLDEADRMLDMGFSEEVLRIIGQSSADRQTLLFSATLKHNGLSAITDVILKDPKVVIVDQLRAKHENIDQAIMLTDDADHKEKVLAWLLKNETFQKAVVFCRTKAGCDHLGNVLRYGQHKSAVLHGDLDQRERNRIMDLYRRDVVNVLIATDVASRGLDVPGIDLVINFDMPRNGDDYVHRIGRTGRAGQQGNAITFVLENQWNLMASIEHYLHLSFDHKVVNEVKGKFTGPKKLKKSGKAATKGKRKDKRGAKYAEEKPQERKKKRLRDQKNIGKRRKPAAGEKAVQDVGFEPLKKK